MGMNLKRDPAMVADVTAIPPWLLIGAAFSIFQNRYGDFNGEAPAATIKGDLMRSSTHSFASAVKTGALVLLLAFGGSTVPWVSERADAASSEYAGPAQERQTRFDSLSDLCSGLNKSGKNYKDCVAERARAHRPSPGELKCYAGAGLAMGAMLADNYITKGEARVLAARLIAAGAFGCVSAWLL